MRHRFAHRFLRRFTTPTTLQHLGPIDRPASDDLVQPGREAGIPAKARQRIPDLHERVLRHLLGIGRGARDAKRQRVRAGLVTFDEQAEGGCIVAGIVRMIHRQRTWELIQRERIAAIERGVAPEIIAQMQPPILDDERGQFMSARATAEKLRQSLMIGGIITLFVRVALAFFLNGVTGGENVWMVGLIPIAAGLGLIVSSAVVRPTSDGPPAPPAR